MDFYNFQSDGFDAQRQEMTKSISRNIKNIRLKRKLTQEQTAEHAEINPKYLGEIERGEKNPTASIVLRLSKVLGVPVCEILKSDRCPYAKGTYGETIMRLCTGREETELNKAVRILEVFFE